MRKFVILLFVLIGSNAFGQDTLSRKLNLKLTLVDVNFIFQPNISVGAEFLVNKTKDLGLEPGIGYVYYSTEEGVKARGFRAYQTLNQYIETNNFKRLGISYTFYYSNVNITSPLLVEKTVNNFAFNQYVETKYKKIRTGFSMEFLGQILIKNRLSLDLLMGGKVTYFATKVPSHVVQKDFPNGVLYRKEGAFFAPSIRVKFGFRI